MSDYRSHLSVAIWAALVALVLGTIIPLPSRTLTAQVFSSPVSIVLTGRMFATLVAVVVVVAGLEAAIRTHPREELLQHTYRYWGLPSAIVMSAAAILPAAPSEAWWLVALVLTGLALAAATIGEYHTVDLQGPTFHNARLVLNALVYAMAALSFVLIYSARTRSLISASLIGVIGGLLALDILRDITPTHRHALLYGLVTGLVMAQVTWVFNYWPYTSIRVGLLLLVAFYFLVGLAHQHLAGRLTLRRSVEYLALATVAAGLVVWFPGV